MEINHVDMSGNDIVLFTIVETLILYIKITNQFFRKHVHKDGSIKFKEVLFSNHGKNYRKCIINKKRFLQHRLVYYANNLDWDIMDSSIATNIIDHIDCNPKNNHISNLRNVTHQQNQWNRSNTKGYYWNKQSKKWIGQIRKDGKQEYIGSFDKEEDASQAYLEVKMRLHIIP